MERKNSLFAKYGKAILTFAAGITVAVLKIWLDTSEQSVEEVETINIDNEADIVVQHESGEKYWNKAKDNWEKDGEPYTYRVTYKDLRDGEIHTQDYNDVDNGYEQYQWYDKQWWAIGTEWNHVPPEDQ